MLAGMMQWLRKEMGEKQSRQEKATTSYEEGTIQKWIRSPPYEVGTPILSQQLKKTYAEGPNGRSK
jgi:hypothetical protein